MIAKMQLSSLCRPARKTFSTFAEIWRQEQASTADAASSPSGALPLEAPEQLSTELSPKLLCGVWPGFGACLLSALPSSVTGRQQLCR